ncbi:nucleoside 2-deoxyribosyltransferase [Mycoplasma sp. Mirounga ES2805-ORL]|uniref:nucleoside 2-deoxyribosyltransferase n=1 Tax=Mycoplasma sp. Mirounga ES2805-ORL TaxID=754514 RepID=UPI00197C2D48|nr:nucleoside 2-deoxyribosyltransferase [Mycoplasma sp. Mirounga ES2805-ORL]QSF13861.1 nucleoside 2-deoxyribosyltransferase [Mycoplasma sp. Mirounga ES2805-ORL]
MKRIYFANALFSKADTTFNAEVVKKIRGLGKYEVYLPQENLSINDKTKCATSKDIYKADKDELDKSDILVAVLDGLVIDPGVCTEIGLFAATNKKIIGLTTDPRKTGSSKLDDPKLKLIADELVENQFAYFNLFVIGAIKQNGKVVSSVEELIKELE